jgi:hypothetical protein
MCFSQTPTPKTGTLPYKYETVTGVIGGSINVYSNFYGLDNFLSTPGTAGYYSDNVGMTSGFSSYTISPILPSLGYIDGVNTIDLLKIQQHILAIVPLTNWFDRVAADADGSSTISVADLNEVKDLVLGVTTTLSVPEWRYMNKALLDAFGEDWSLLDTPLSGGYSPTTLITNPNMVFRCTKPGDINGTNSSIAGMTFFPYFNSSVLESRDAAKVYEGKKDQIIKVDVVLDASDDIYAYEVPLHINKDVFEIIKLSFDSKYNYVKGGEFITTLDFQSTRDPLFIKGSHTVASYLLKLKRNVENAYDEIKVTEKRDLILADKNAELDSESKLFLDIEETSLTNSFTAFAFETESEVNLNVDSEISGLAQISIFNIQGQLLKSQEVELHLRENQITLDKSIFTKGVNLITINAQGLPLYTLKLVVSK